MKFNNVASDLVDLICGLVQIVGEEYEVNPDNQFDYLSVPSRARDAVEYLVQALYSIRVMHHDEKFRFVKNKKKGGD